LVIEPFTPLTMERSRYTLTLALLLLSMLRSLAQLGPLNWTEPVQVEANNIFLVWHESPSVGNQAHQKTYSYDFHSELIPADERITATPQQAASTAGPAVFTDVDNGKFTDGARDNVVSIWGPGPSGISLSLPHFDTSAMAWTTAVEQQITGDIQSDRIYVRTLDIDGDSLDEFVVSYLDSEDSIHFALYDVDSLLQPTLLATRCDQRAIAPASGRVRYTIAVGDFNGDGTRSWHRSGTWAPQGPTSTWSCGSIRSTAARWCPRGRISSPRAGARR
jgi:hypothetical protein